MIEERGRVLAVEGDRLWIETVRRSACDSCQARNGCGQSLLQRLGLGARQGYIQVVNQAQDNHYRAGDEVRIGIAENAVVRGSVLVYLVPLLGLFGGALLAQASGVSEPWIVSAAVCGLGAGFVVTGWLARRAQGDPAFMPRLLGRASDAQGVVSEICVKE